MPEYLETKAASSTTNDLANENITGVKLPLLQLPRFSGNVLEWSAFYDAFIASVDSHKKLSNVQKFTHLRSCLSRKAYHCIEGYSVTNDKYTKALQDLKDRFGRKRLLVNELVKSIISLEVPETAEGKAIRPLYDTLKNRMRSLESLGLKPDDNPSLSMVLLPIFDTKLPRELKEKWEFELTKCENDDEVNIKKFFQFLEGHVLSNEANQELWARYLNWDDPLDVDIAQAWGAWKKELPSVDKIKVPRYLLRGLDLSSIAKIEVHGFADSSQKAYGSAVYLCAEDQNNNRVSSLVMAKSRVAPMKRVTLPRLELLAAFITAKLLHYVVQALRISVDSVYAWSDSQIALAWIRRPSSRWKVFVANRVEEIQQKVPPSQWRFCPGSQNPADLVTRGISAAQLKESTLWWNGPHWLRQPTSYWPEREVQNAFSQLDNSRNVVFRQ